MRQNNLGEYHRCPTSKGRQKGDTFSELVNRTIDKLQTLKTNNISKTGKVVVILAHVKSMSAHPMQCF